MCGSDKIRKRNIAFIFLSGERVNLEMIDMCCLLLSDFEGVLVNVQLF